MGITYFKRFRMEIDLEGSCFAPAQLPAQYQWLPWDAGLINDHAETKFRSFQAEIDANVFPCLAARDGCRRLMQEISRRDCFIPEATWLLVYVGESAPKSRRPKLCGTVQGVRDEQFGSIQNLGVTPEHRGMGLGTRLLERSLEGFHRVGLSRAYLEVTARNAGAIRLYERFGFRKVCTVYKSVEVATA